ncbi:molybdopterin biosynthesis protein [Fusibacter bizertensis]
MRKENNVFISNLPLSDALLAFEHELKAPYAIEQVNIQDAINRRTSCAVFAERSSPSNHCAAMDGIAVRAADTHGANERNPVRLKEKSQFVYVNTGNLFPSEMDAVIMIEDINLLENGEVEIIEAAYPWQHIRQVGEDIIKGEMILPSNHMIRPIDLGALLQGGIEKIMVYKPFKVGIIPTGNEIVKRVDELTSGKIIDSNSSVIAALVKEVGGEAKIYPICIDDQELLTEAIQLGTEENDLLLTIAGSSAGKKDYTVDIIKKLGEVIVHGVAIKPGKPTILGKVNGVGVIGLPGYPVSCYIAFQSFVTPIIDAWTHQNNRAHMLSAITTQKIISSMKHEEVIRVTVGEVANKWVATPLNREAGSTMSLVRADGLIIIPRLVEGFEVGKSVSVKLLKPIEQLRSRLVMIGSHDPLIDILSDQMPLASTHVGSFGGIMSLKRMECHMAPIHLLDEMSGEYNITAAQQYFPGKEMVLIRGVRRLQGLFVKKGNPRNILKLSDLSSPDIRFINRQRGAGTRVLLDFELSKSNIDVETINGYTREVTTHTAVAVAVATDSADVGLGVYSAAKAMEIDFIPLGFENYDFLTYKEMLSDNRVSSFISILKSNIFKEAVELLGGYELDHCGEIIEIGDNK